MGRYYAEKLAAERLRRCYAIAPPRIRRYLEAEIRHLCARLRPGDRVLELGCGYGRVLARLRRETGASSVTGVDSARDSLYLARAELARLAAPGCRLAAMDAGALGFRDGSFDAVVCVQNGIEVFGIEPRRLVAEAVRVTRPGGRVLLSTYSRGIWEERLAWFRLQVAAGLLGPIDERATGRGVIVCEDGFRSGRAGHAELAALAALVEPAGGGCRITEVDGSSLFCELTVGAAGAGGG